MIDAAREGREVDLAPYAEKGEARAVIRAEVLRALILQLYDDWPVDPKGVQIRNARIMKQLDLSHTQIMVPLCLHTCELDNRRPSQGLSTPTRHDQNEREKQVGEVAVSLDLAHVQLVDFTDCIFRSSFSMIATTVKGDCRLEGSIIDGALYIEGAAIAGKFIAERTVFFGSGACALSANGLNVTSDLVLDEAEFGGSVWLKGAEIHGQIIARYACFNASEDPSLFAEEVRTTNCFLDGSEFTCLVSFAGSRLSGQFVARNARFKGEASPSFLGLAMEICGECLLDESEFREAVNLARAKIGGMFGARRTKFCAGVGRGLDFECVTVGLGCILDESEFRATVYFAGTKINHQFVAEKTKFRACQGPALNAQGAEIAGLCRLDRAEFEGPAQFVGARVSGPFMARGASFFAKNGCALICQSAHIGGGCVLEQCRFTATAQLAGANIEGQFAVKDSEFEGDADTSLGLFGIDVRHECILDGNRFSTTVNASDARIGGQLIIGRSKFGSEGSWSFVAQGMMIRQDLLIRQCEFEGTVIVAGANIGRSVLFRETKLRGAMSNVALDATGCRVGGDCRFTDDFQANGALILDRARIQGMLVLNNARLLSRRAIDQQARRGPKSVPAQTPAAAGRTGKDTALSLVQATVGHIRWEGGKENRARGVVNLTRASVDTLEDAEATWLPGTQGEHFLLDGFVYEHLLNPSGRATVNGRHEEVAVATARVRWLLGQCPEHVGKEFKTQPWVQLAAVLRRQGLEIAAREIEIEGRRRLRKATKRGWSRFQDWFLDRVAGYGFKPWHTVGCSVLTVLLFWGVWAFASLGCTEAGCRDETVFVRTAMADYMLDGNEADYPDFNPLGYAFDVFIPIFDFGYQNTWAPRTWWPEPIEVQDPFGPKGATLMIPQCVGGFFYLLYVVEVFWGALLVTIAIAGFSGLLRRAGENR
ncbi:MAG TPA: hypothetical protein ENJ83_00425 [Rhodospirillales bacterium]|nr:hypothetical protein [Rhodospirillales bacterium]